METIYILGFEIGIILLGLKFFSIPLGIIFGIIVLGTIFIVKKDFFLLIFGLFFLLRIVTSVDINIHNIGDNFTIKSTVYNNRGKIEKFNGKYPYLSSYIEVSNLPNGKYILFGKIENVKSIYENIYYQGEILEIKQLNKNFIEKYIQKRSENFLKTLPYDVQRFYKAVILGNSKVLHKELKEKFTYIGIAHLISLSGFHIGVIISILNSLTFKLPLKKRGKNIALFIFLTLYYLGIEKSPSLDRAYLMGSIYLAGKIFNENSDFLKTLTLTWIVTLFIQPILVENISFQLSYIAVFIIAGVYPLFKEKFQWRKSKILDSVILTLIIQIFLTPLLIKNFGTIQIFSLFSNILLVPLGSIFIVLGFLALLLENIYLGFLIAPLLNLSYKLFIFFVDITAKIPYMSINYIGNRKNIFFNIFYFFLIGIVFYLKYRKEGHTDEKIYRRDKISQ